MKPKTLKINVSDEIKIHDELGNLSVDDNYFWEIPSWYQEKIDARCVKIPFNSFALPPTSNFIRYQKTPVLF
jgi:hypothetical protein